ncbi:unnamed protein product [Phytomonas sp. Hart1]|nr:unnamed protein product [Phytomonas sp. Hart1]|eukprot:CCW69685.1 unnamed protein product [Phytomonas sp. isolate Hart1]
MSRRQFLRDMRTRSTEFYRSDSSTASTQNISFASQDPDHILEKPYQTCEEFMDPTDTCSALCNSDRIIEHNSKGTSTDFQCVLTVPRSDNIPFRLPTSDTTDTHETIQSAHPKEVDLTGDCLARNFCSHNLNPFKEFLGSALASHSGEGLHQGESSLNSSLFCAEMGPSPVATRGLQERLTGSGLVPNIADVEPRDDIGLKVITKKSVVSFNTDLSAVTGPVLDVASGIASLPTKSLTTLGEFTPNPFHGPNLSSLIQENHKSTCNDDNKKSGFLIDSNGSPLNSFASGSHLMGPSQSTLMNTLGTNADIKDQYSNARDVDALLLSIQVELANEKKRNIEAERLISSLNHEIEYLRAENLSLSAAMPFSTSAGGKLMQDTVTDTAVRGTTPTTYIMELEQRISKITATLETKRSELEAKDERIRLLEHTLANRFLSTVVTPAAASTSVTLPPQSIAHTATRVEVRTANIPDILSRTQTPGSTAVIINSKSSSLYDRNSFTEESKHLNNPCKTVVLNRSGIEQPDDTPQLPAPTLNLAGKSSEKILHHTIDAMRHTSKTTLHSLECAELSSSRSKVIDGGHIDFNKSKSDETITNHQSASPPPPHFSVRSKRREGIRKAEASSMRGQEDAQLRIFPKQVRHPSVDLSNWRHGNSDRDSACASPRKPSVRRTPRGVSTTGIHPNQPSGTAADSARRSSVPGPRASTATRTSFSHPYRTGPPAAPSVTASTAKETAHPPAAGPRPSSKPLCTMMRAWGHRGGRSLSPHGSPSLRSATSVNSRPRILFNEKDETTVMHGKTTTAVFRNSATRHPTPLASGVDKLREPIVRVTNAASLIPSVEPEEAETGGFMKK